jgi:predicted RNA-binding protein with PUA-like domain
MRYWLIKSEPSMFGIDDLASSPKQSTSWDGVRNFQARNMLRDEFAVGDLAFFYHSSCPEPGIAGIVEVVRAGYPDPSAWNRKSPYHDIKSPENKPLWYTVDVKLKQRCAAVLSLTRLRMHESGKLAGLLLLRRGNRLSVTPVEHRHWKFILELMNQNE